VHVGICADIVRVVEVYEVIGANLAVDRQRSEKQEDIDREIARVRRSPRNVRTACLVLMIELGHGLRDSKDTSADYAESATKHKRILHCGRCCITRPALAMDALQKLDDGNLALETPPDPRTGTTVFEAQPLLCVCGARMRIVCFIADPRVADRILGHRDSERCQRQFPASRLFSLAPPNKRL
jgi:hypothetical protein